MIVRSAAMTNCFRWWAEKNEKVNSTMNRDGDVDICEGNEEVSLD